MHIPENYLSPTTCAAMGAVMLPIWYKAVKEVKVKVNTDKQTIPMLGIGTSLSFLIMMFNLPAPGGTSAHAVGAVLIAILLGPWASCLAVSVALAMQALLFGDGGILAFGAEWDVQELVEKLSHYHVVAQAPKGMLNGFSFHAIFPDYSIAGIPEVLGYILSAASAVLISFVLYRLIFGRKVEK